MQGNHRKSNPPEISKIRGISSRQKKERKAELDRKWDSPTLEKKRKPRQPRQPRKRPRNLLLLVFKKSPKGFQIRLLHRVKKPHEADENEPVFGLFRI